MCIGAGLGRIEEYLPPPPGENISYRIWNLWCKENPASNLRMIVRSKVRIHSNDETIRFNYIFGLKSCSFYVQANDRTKNIKCFKIIGTIVHHIRKKTEFHRL